MVQPNEDLFDFDKPLLTEVEANKIFSVTGIDRKYEAAVRRHLEDLPYLEFIRQNAGKSLVQ